jgi:tryptophan synthase alpha chain
LGRIGQTFTTLKAKGQKALVVYIMGGDPNLELTEELIPFLAELGVDLVEIGVPFSDPLADGPTIQAAGQRALNTTLPQLVEMVSRLRPKVEIPLLFMTYINPVMHWKYDRFVSEIAGAGLDGVIIPI